MSAESWRDGISTSSSKFLDILSEEKPKRVDWHADSPRHAKFQHDLDGFLAEHKRQKMAQLFTRQLEKRAAWQQLLDYNPWGKPFGGAPPDSDDYRRRFMDFGGRDEVKPVAPLVGSRQGGGDPLRSESGRARARLPVAPNLLFQDRRSLMRPRRLDFERESVQEMAEALDHGIRDRAFREEQERLSKLAGSPTMNSYDRWQSPYRSPEHDAWSPRIREHLETPMMRAHRSFLQPVLSPEPRSQFVRRSHHKDRFEVSEPVNEGYRTLPPFGTHE